MPIKPWKLTLINNDDSQGKIIRFHTAAELFRYVDINNIERCVVDGPKEGFSELYSEFQIKPECSKMVH
jgi:hypothetical protein